MKYLSLLIIFASTAAASTMNGEFCVALDNNNKKTILPTLSRQECEKKGGNYQELTLEEYDSIVGIGTEELAIAN